MAKKLPKYKMEQQVKHLLFSKTYYLLKADIITLDEYREMDTKIRERWGDTKISDAFPEWLDN